MQTVEKQQNKMRDELTTYQVEKHQEQTANKIQLEEQVYIPKDVKPGYKQIEQFNTWYKLYKLINYSITEDMFKGSSLSFKSLNTYKGQIKRIIEGNPTKSATNTMIKYVKKLQEKGVTPFASISKSTHGYCDSKYLDDKYKQYVYSPVSSIVTRTTKVQKTRTRKQTTLYVIVQSKTFKCIKTSNDLKHIKGYMEALNENTDSSYKLYKLDEVVE